LKPILQSWHLAHFSRSAALLGSLLVVGPAATAQESPHGFPMLFHLLPESHWAPGKAPTSQELEGAIDDMLTEGQIYLYREGDEKSTVTLEANEVGNVPAGKWHWIAEAPGYVSSFSGSFMISAAMAADPHAKQKTIIWSVVPACRIELNKDRKWETVHRLDFVSFPRNMLYPLFPEDRDSLWLPTGHNLTYSMGNRGLQGLTDLGACRQFELVTVDPPEPPAVDRQDFMVHLAPREDVDRDRLDWNKLSVFFEAVRKDAMLGPAPTGRLWTGARWTLFFLDVPAAGTWNLVARHPKLRSVVVAVDSVGGSARELSPEELKPRRDFSFEADFKPKHPHKVAELLTYYCGRSRRPPKEKGQCGTRIDRQPFQDGLHEYALENLDDGLYWFYAVIDDETLFALGSNVEIFLDPENDDVPFFPRLPLHEMEIYGNILVAGEPVEGAVKLIPRISTPDMATDRFEHDRARIFPTDKDLLYHIYFFGGIQWFEHFPPVEGEEEPVRGLYPGTAMLQACASDGICRGYNFHSRFAGEGRLDLDIDSGRSLTVKAVDAADGSLLASAEIYVRDSTNVIDFDHGEVRFVEPPGGEATVYTTDSEGRVHFTVPENMDSPMTVGKKGYQRWKGYPPAGAETLEVALEPDVEKPAESGIKVVFEDDDEPVRDGYFLLAREDGLRDLKCSEATNSAGIVFFHESCLDIGLAVFVHPRALIKIFNKKLLAIVPEVRIQRAPERPILLRVTDADAQPVADLPVGFRFRSLTLDPNDLLFAFSRTGGYIYFRTDRTGHLALRNVSPDSSDVPEVFATLSGYAGSVSLSDALEGVLELVVE